MGRPAVSGVAGSSGSRPQHNEDAATLLEDIRHRCERLLTGVLEHHCRPGLQVKGTQIPIRDLERLETHAMAVAVLRIHIKD